MWATLRKNDRAPDSTAESCDPPGSTTDEGGIDTAAGDGSLAGGTAAPSGSRRSLKAAEAGPGLGVLGDLPGQDLQRHAAAEGDLLGLVDYAHAAPADLAEDPVVAHLAQRR